MTNEQVYLELKDKLEKGDKLQKKGCSPKDYADIEKLRTRFYKFAVRLSRRLTL